MVTFRDNFRRLPEDIKKFPAEVRKAIRDAMLPSVEKSKVKEIRLEATGSVETVASPKHPDRNEDHGAIDLDRAFAMVADGVSEGGGRRGEQAGRVVHERGTALDG